MNDMILDTNNYCSPIYTVDQSSPHYEAVWKLFGHLGWSKEQRRANFIQGRFNAFSSILHKLNQKSAYVFSTDLSKMSHTVRGWPISYDCLTQTIKRLEELEWLVRHKPEVENQDFLFDLAGVEKPTKRARGKADRFVAPEGSPLRLGYELTVVPILDKQGRHHIGPSICLYARGNKNGDRGSLMVEDLYADWRETKQHIKAPIDRINNLINQHDYQHPDYSNLNKWGELQYRRQFIGSLQRYGRLHNNFQNESNRKMLTIDGSSIAEVDVHASALQILAGHSETKFTLPDVEDLYQAGQLQNLNREIIKTLVQVVLNSSKPLLERKYWPKSITDDEEKKALIEGDGIPWAAYRDAVATTYPSLTNLPKDFGMRLFRLESDIIVYSMLQLLEAGIGCLSVHDCLVVPNDKVEEAKKAFVNAYAQFGFKPPKLKIDYAV